MRVFIHAVSPVLALMLMLMSPDAFAQAPNPSAAGVEQERIQLERERIEQDVDALCSEKVVAEAEKGEAHFRDCTAISNEERDQNISKLHDLRDQALGDCRQKAVDTERAFLGREEQRLQDDIARARARIARNKKALQRLGLPALTDAFETWGDLAEDQRIELRNSAIISSLIAGAEAIKEGAHGIQHLTPQEAKRWLAWLKSIGVSEPFLEDGIRKLAAAPDRVQFANELHAVAEAIRQGAETGEIAARLNQKQLEAIPAVLGLLLKTPDANGAAAFGEFMVTWGFAMKALDVINPDLNQVLYLPERDLAEVHRISHSIQISVGEVNDGKDGLRVIEIERRRLVSPSRNPAP